MVTTWTLLVGVAFLANNPLGKANKRVIFTDDDDDAASDLGADSGCGVPLPPSESKLQCTAVSGCLVKCNPGYAFPDGSRHSRLKCHRGRWFDTKAGPDYPIPGCSPVCTAPCQNKGLCILPNTCHCQAGYSGKQCEIELVPPCLSSPPPPASSSVQCTTRDCTITCKPGHTFPNGDKKIQLTCVNGAWQPNNGQHSLDDCQPDCNPPCENGGTCGSVNNCICTNQFRGQRCQYDIARCAPTKLGFNGAYNCSSSGLEYRCDLRCPTGLHWFPGPPPSQRVTCDLATATFTPSSLPTCQPEGVILSNDGININSHQTVYGIASSHSNDQQITSNWSQNSLGYDSHASQASASNHSGSRAQNYASASAQSHIISDQSLLASSVEDNSNSLVGQHLQSTSALTNLGSSSQSQAGSLGHSFYGASAQSHSSSSAHSQSSASALTSFGSSAQGLSGSSAHSFYGASAQSQSSSSSQSYSSASAHILSGSAAFGLSGSSAQSHSSSQSASSSSMQHQSLLASQSFSGAQGLSGSYSQSHGSLAALSNSDSSKQSSSAGSLSLNVEGQRLSRLTNQASSSSAYNQHSSSARVIRWFSMEHSTSFNATELSLLANQVSGDLDKVDGSCMFWSGHHIKTFDGNVFSLPSSSCRYTLVNEPQDNSVRISVERDETKPNGLKVFLLLEGEHFTMEQDSQGRYVVMEGGRSLSVPGQHGGISFNKAGDWLFLDILGLGFSLRWNGQDYLIINGDMNVWERTSGLCGSLNSNPFDDWQSESGDFSQSFPDFIQLWTEETDMCELAVSQHPCSVDSGLFESADRYCSPLVAPGSPVAMCHAHVDPEAYYQACRWSYCHKHNGFSQRSQKLRKYGGHQNGVVDGPNGYQDHENGHANGQQGSGLFTGSQTSEIGACQAIEAYVRVCTKIDSLRLVERNLVWRSPDFCPMECPHGMVYKLCGPGESPHCGNSVDEDEDIKQEIEFCVEGCYCPQGKRFHQGRCIEKAACPCVHNGKEFNNGDQLRQDCNICTCVNSQWRCTEKQCNRRCSVVGDPHFTTFDGKNYDFMGQCSYTMVDTGDITIDIDTAVCTGIENEELLTRTYESHQPPTCVRSASLRLGNELIQLRQRKEILVNSREIDRLQLPTILANGVILREGSSQWILVEIPNLLTVWWDGFKRLYIDATPKLIGKTTGMCGTFTNSQGDDFTSPEGDVENNPILFGNKWKASPGCPQSQTVVSHPCDANPDRRDKAHAICAALKGASFQGCHDQVDPEFHYESCVHDVCACKGSLSKCFCPIFGAYSDLCAMKGSVLDWRLDLPECGLRCPQGQIYRQCVDSCTYSCRSLASPHSCQMEADQCVEGCSCPEGQALSDAGVCVPVSSCPCIRDGTYFEADSLDYRPESAEICACHNANWQCRHANKSEVLASPELSCQADQHMVYSKCVSKEGLTCQNMHMHSADDVDADKEDSPGCRGGCICLPGYVFNEDGVCIPSESCPCHHGGRSYKPGDSVRKQCNTCQCDDGEWKCTNMICPGLCTVWGEGHFVSFDDRKYDFSGTCDYTLAKGHLSQSDSFTISFRNIPCGTSTVTCSKAAAITVGTGTDSEKINLLRGKEPKLTVHHKRMKLRDNGQLLIVDVHDMGLSVEWDRSNRLAVRLKPRWRGNVKGLCGNFNGDAEDDTLTQSGLRESSPVNFGDSWKLHSYCPAPVPQQDTCAKFPTRKTWSAKKCGILKSAVFKPCHSEVPLQPWFDQCVRDACGCTAGGDCECLCTALGAYAQACNEAGIHIKWRSQKICAMQCPKGSSYSPCTPSCPMESCDNTHIFSRLLVACAEESCYEGCSQDSCPNNQILKSEHERICVDRKDCHVGCLSSDGTKYNNGDIMETSQCSICTCENGEKQCQQRDCDADMNFAQLQDLKASKDYGVQNCDRPDQLLASEDCNKYLQCHQDYQSQFAVKEETCDPGSIFDPNRLGCQPTAQVVPNRWECSHYMPAMNLQFIFQISQTKDKLKQFENFINQAEAASGTSNQHSEVHSLKESYMQMSQMLSSVERKVLAKESNMQVVLQQVKLAQQSVSSKLKIVLNKSSRLQIQSVVSELDELSKFIHSYSGNQAQVSSSIYHTQGIGQAQGLSACSDFNAHTPVADDCASFYQCVPVDSNRGKLVKKTCGPGTLFNPQTTVCDYPLNVYRANPACQEAKQGEAKQSLESYGSGSGSGGQDYSQSSFTDLPGSTYQQSSLINKTVNLSSSGFVSINYSKTTQDLSHLGMANNQAGGNVNGMLQTNLDSQANQMLTKGSDSGISYTGSQVSGSQSSSFSTWGHASSVQSQSNTLNGQGSSANIGSGSANLHKSADANGNLNLINAHQNMNFASGSRENQETNNIISSQAGHLSSIGDLVSGTGSDRTEHHKSSLNLQYGSGISAQDAAAQKDLTSQTSSVNQINQQQTVTSQNVGQYNQNTQLQTGQIGDYGYSSAGAAASNAQSNNLVQNLATNYGLNQNNSAYGQTILNSGSMTQSSTFRNHSSSSGFAYSSSGNNDFNFSVNQRNQSAGHDHKSSQTWQNSFNTVGGAGHHSIYSSGSNMSTDKASLDSFAVSASFNQNRQNVVFDENDHQDYGSGSGFTNQGQLQQSSNEQSSKAENLVLQLLDEISTDITILPSMKTPPAPCNPKYYIDLLPLLTPSAFKSSSNAPGHEPDQIVMIQDISNLARINIDSSNEDSWIPEVMKVGEYAEFQFEEITPIFGLQLSGTSQPEGYVTSFMILYSHDGFAFFHILDNAGKPKIFSGPYDYSSSISTDFLVGIEAKYVRFYPLTWVGAISVRMKLFGCNRHSAVAQNLQMINELERAKSSKLTSLSSDLKNVISIINSDSELQSIFSLDSSALKRLIEFQDTLKGQRLMSTSFKDLNTNTEEVKAFTRAISNVKHQLGLISGNAGKFQELLAKLEGIENGAVGIMKSSVVTSKEGMTFTLNEGLQNEVHRLQKTLSLMRNEHVVSGKSTELLDATLAKLTRHSNGWKTAGADAPTGNQAFQRLTLLDSMNEIISSVEIIRAVNDDYDSELMKISEDIEYGSDALRNINELSQMISTDYLQSGHNVNMDNIKHGQSSSFNQVTQASRAPYSCLQTDLFDLLVNLPDSAFSASSSAANSEPSYARVLDFAVFTRTAAQDLVMAESWMPNRMSDSEYLEVDLTTEQQIFGFQLLGDSVTNSAVSSFNMMCSRDGLDYQYMINEETNGKVFHGSDSNRDPISVFFSQAYTCRKVKLVPLTWNNNIAVKIEIYGCKKPQSNLSAGIIDSQYGSQTVYDGKAQLFLKEMKDFIGHYNVFVSDLNLNFGDRSLQKLRAVGANLDTIIANFENGATTNKDRVQLLRVYKQASNSFRDELTILKDTISGDAEIRNHYGRLSSKLDGMLASSSQFSNWASEQAAIAGSSPSQSNEMLVQLEQLKMSTMGFFNSPQIQADQYLASIGTQTENQFNSLIKTLESNAHSSQRDATMLNNLLESQLSALRNIDATQLTGDMRLQLNKVISNFESHMLVMKGDQQTKVSNAMIRQQVASVAQSQNIIQNLIDRNFPANYPSSAAFVSLANNMRDIVTQMSAVDDSISSVQRSEKLKKYSLDLSNNVMSLTKLVDNSMISADKGAVLRELSTLNSKNKQFARLVRGHDASLSHNFNTDASADEYESSKTQIYGLVSLVNQKLLQLATNGDISNDHILSEKIRAAQENFASMLKTEISGAAGDVQSKDKASLLTQLSQNMALLEEIQRHTTFQNSQNFGNFNAYVQQLKEAQENLELSLITTDLSQWVDASYHTLDVNEKKEKLTESFATAGSELTKSMNMLDQSFYQVKEELVSIETQVKSLSSSMFNADAAESNQKLAIMNNKVNEQIAQWEKYLYSDKVSLQQKYVIKQNIMGLKKIQLFSREIQKLNQNAALTSLAGGSHSMNSNILLNLQQVHSNLAEILSQGHAHKDLHVWQNMKSVETKLSNIISQATSHTIGDAHFNFDNMASMIGQEISALTMISKNPSISLLDQSNKVNAQIGQLAQLQAQLGTWSSTKKHSSLQESFSGSINSLNSFNNKLESLKTFTSDSHSLQTITHATSVTSGLKKEMQGMSQAFQLNGKLTQNGQLKTEVEKFQNLKMSFQSKSFQSNFNQDSLHLISNINQDINLISESVQEILHLTSSGTTAIPTSKPSPQHVEDPSYVKESPSSRALKQGCTKDLGLTNKNLPASFISYSSFSPTTSSVAGGDAVRLLSPTGWRPARDDMQQHITVDFGSPRNVAGIKTQGYSGPQQIWVEAFAIQYSRDGHIWSSIRDGLNVGDRVFVGNFDPDSINVQYFDHLVNARLIRVIPLKWHNSIGLRLELIGCYIPYIISTQPTGIPSSSLYTSSPGLAGDYTSTATPSIYREPYGPSGGAEQCQMCPGIEYNQLYGAQCPCSGNLHWNGNTCVSSNNCDCLLGNMRIERNSSRINSKCEVCSCAWGSTGPAVCQPKVCPPCSPGSEKYSSLTLDCQCICKACERGSRLCPTSKVCIPDSLWCDGVEHCPDDERDCPSSPDSNPVSLSGQPCPQLRCGPGTQLVETEVETVDGCPFYKCIVATDSTPGCPQPSCPSGYRIQEIEIGAARLILQQGNTARYSSGSNGNSQYGDQNGGNPTCPEYECVPEDPLQLPVNSADFSTCTYGGNMLETFDRSVHVHPICSHVLLQSQYGVKIQYGKTCKLGEACEKFLMIKDVKNGEDVKINANFQVFYNSDSYDSKEAAKITQSRLFRISVVGNKMQIRILSLNWWLEWSQSGSVKILVPTTYQGVTSGLCGNMNGNPQDDRMSRNGRILPDTATFFEEWETAGSSRECDQQEKGASVTTTTRPDLATTGCTPKRRERAGHLCKAVRFPPFNACHDKVSMSLYLLKCFEETCECLANSDDDDSKCRCEVMENYATSCLEKDPDVHLEGWRKTHFCPASCPPGLIHYDCYRASCELTCSNIKLDNPCPVKQTGVCFPGCYCPSGLVKEGDTCVEKSQCRNCECKFGGGIITTFNGDFLSVGRDQTSKLVRLHSQGAGDEFSLAATVNDCSIGVQRRTCLDEASVQFASSELKIQLTPDRPELTTISLDGIAAPSDSVLGQFGFKVERSTPTILTIEVTQLHVEIEFDLIRSQMAFKAPFTLYSDRLEGLCGNCSTDIPKHADSSSIPSSTDSQIFYPQPSTVPYGRTTTPSPSWSRPGYLPGGQPSYSRVPTPVPEYTSSSRSTPRPSQTNVFDYDQRPANGSGGPSTVGTGHVFHGYGSVHQTDPVSGWQQPSQPPSYDPARHFTPDSSFVYPGQAGTTPGYRPHVPASSQGPSGQYQPSPGSTTASPSQSRSTTYYGQSTSSRPYPMIVTTPRPVYRPAYTTSKPASSARPGYALPGQPSKSGGYQGQVDISDPVVFVDDEHDFMVDCNPHTKRLCQFLLKNTFSKCHAVVDARAYVAQCEEQLCSNDIDDHMEILCSIGSEYASNCHSKGFCVEWRQSLNCPSQVCPSGSSYQECGPGCDKDCSGQMRCNRPRGPDCYCNPGMVLLNGVCRPQAECVTCKDASSNDGQSKHPGDVWNPDPCAECKCTDKGTVTCTRTQCPSPVCELGKTLKTLPPAPGECCPTKLCEVESSRGQKCPDVVRPDCGEFQSVKSLKDDITGCVKYICECVSTCPDVGKEPDDLRPGEEYKLVTSGCCPARKKVCVKSRCDTDLPKVNCPAHLIRTIDLNTKQDCCPKYICEKPDDKCVYTMKNVHPGSVIVKSVNSTWKDGPCRRCKCNPAKPTIDCPDKQPEAVCSVQRCNNREKNRDSYRYVVEDLVDDAVCCPGYRKVACKYQQQVYQINDSWTDPNDPCRAYSCVSESGEANIVSSTQVCDTECDQGSTYVASSDGKCCGTCSPTSCQMQDGSLIQPGGEKITACGKHSCIVVNNKAVLSYEAAKCPEIPKGCTETVPDTSGCCQLCNQCVTAQGVYKFGATWKKDRCTNCQCQGGQVECQTRTCELVTCEAGFVGLSTPNPLDACCPKTVCLPKQSENLDCPEAVVPVCGPHQEVRTVTNAQSCVLLVCECVATCPDPSTQLLEPGEELVPSAPDGCCPGAREVRCNPASCPPPPPCSPPGSLVAASGSDPRSCCPQLSCDLPEMKCIYTMENDNSGLVKEFQLGETWTDGACTKCRCVSLNRTQVVIQAYGTGVQANQLASPVCEVMTCANKAPSPFTYNSYVVEAIGDGCCSDYRKTACKVNGRVKTIGSEWQSSVDPCLTHQCVLSIDGEASIETVAKGCTNKCPQGTEYRPPRPGVCCGSCEDLTCALPDGTQLGPGQHRQQGPCTTVICTARGNKVVLESRNASCPALPRDCPAHRIQVDESGCCQICVKEQSCSKIELQDTVGLLEVSVPVHGICRNEEPVAGWSDCAGSCSSGYAYKKANGGYLGECTCCQPSGQTDITVTLTCTDGFTFNHKIRVPTGCNCKACVDSDQGLYKQTTYDGPVDDGDGTAPYG